MECRSEGLRSNIHTRMNVSEHNASPSIPIYLQTHTHTAAATWFSRRLV